MALTETALLYFLPWSLDKYLFPGVFSKIILFICSEILVPRIHKILARIKKKKKKKKKKDYERLLKFLRIIECRTCLESGLPF